jgi:hypothetical protein
MERELLPIRIEEMYGTLLGVEQLQCLVQGGAEELV